MSLLSICGKIFESLIYNNLFGFFIANELVSSNQSVSKQFVFKPGNSCITQLLSITHKIYRSFDDGYEVKSVFLDTSKAFDKVWHNGLICLKQSKQNGVSENLLNLIIFLMLENKQSCLKWSIFLMGKC